MAMEKQRKDKSGRWKKTEHDRFMKALEKYGKNWPLVQKAVKTRTLTQVRSHAQKLFLSMTPRDMKQLNYDLDERFDLFCKNEGQLSAESQEGKKQSSHQLMVHKEEDVSSTIHRDHTSDKGFFKEVLILQNPPQNQVSSVRKEETEKKGLVKAEYQLIDNSKGEQVQKSISPTTENSDDYFCCLPPWALYYSMFEALNQFNQVY